jgi:hypothetical protein
MNADPAVDIVRREVLGFGPTVDGMAPWLDAIGDASLALIGEGVRPSLAGKLRAVTVIHLDQTSALEPLERWAR